MSFIGLTTGQVGTDAEHGAPCPYFRKEIIPKRRVKKAVLRIAALGLFKAYWNGREISDDILAPGWTTYTKRIPYYEYDITDVFGEKGGVLDVALADGWYVGRICQGERDRYGAYPLKLWAEVELRYVNCMTETIVTDGTWKASTGKILYGDILCGEYVDNRLEAAFDKEPEVFDCGYEKLLEKADYEHVKKAERLPMKRLSDTLWDTEQNFAGIVRAVVKGSAGAKIRFRYAEILDKNGGIYTENLRKARCTDYFVLKGEGEEVFEPTFTYHGFRYAEAIVEEGEAEVVSMEGIAVHNDLVRTGDFACSNPLVNKIFGNTLWGLRSNFVSVPTDCPQRDERLGWTADAQIFCPTANYLYDCKRFYEKYMTDMRDGQREDGMVYNVAPVFEYRPLMSSSAAWGDAVAIIPYSCYKTYGDKKIIEDNIGAAKKWLSYCKENSRRLLRPKEGFGDWLSIGSVTNKRFIATVYFAYSAKLVAEMCGVIGDKDENEFRQLYEAIRRRIRKRYFHRKKVANDTQTAYILAYVAGIATKEEIADNLVRKLTESNGLLTTGFIGTRYLLPVLCDIGRSDLAYKLIGERRFPSWGYTIDNGATTVWERWDGYRSEKSNPFQNAHMNSYNHYSFGACVGWMFEYVLGIKKDCFCAEKDHYFMKPYFDDTGTVNGASGDYNGIKVAWSRANDIVIYSVKSSGKETFSFDFGGAEILEKREENGSYFFRLGYHRQ